MNQTGRIGALDSLRGVASLIVVIFHCLISYRIFDEANQYQIGSGPIAWLFATPLHSLVGGYEAVLLFFVLSGFVLSIPFVDGRSPMYIAYAVKRVCRIYIPYVVAILGSVVLLSWFATFEPNELLSDSYNHRWQHPVSLSSMFGYVFMTGADVTNVNGVVWTLVHELRISLFLPVLLWVVKRVHWTIAVLAGIALSSGGWIVTIFLKGFWVTPVQQYWNGSIGQTCYYMMFFIFGAALAKHRLGVADVIRRIGGVGQALILVIALTLMNFKWLFHGFEQFKKGMYMTVSIRSTEDLATAVGIIFLMALVIGSKGINRFFSSRPLLFLGKVSYSLYLIHLPVIMLSSLYLSRLIPLAWAFAVVPVIALLIAYLSWRWVEEPSIKLGHFLSKRIQSKREKLVTLQGEG